MCGRFDVPQGAENLPHCEKVGEFLCKETQIKFDSRDRSIGSSLVATLDIEHGLAMHQAPAAQSGSTRNLWWAEKWRSEVAESMTWRMYGSLHSLALRALKADVTAEMLYSTGVGQIVGDSSLWTLSPTPGTSDIAQQTLVKWRSQLREGGFGVCGPKCTKWVKAGSFNAAVDSLEAWLLDIRPDTAAATRRKVATAFAFRGLMASAHLAGIEPAETSPWSTEPAVRSLLVEAVKVANLEANKNWCKAKSAFQIIVPQVSLVPAVPGLRRKPHADDAASGNDLAERLTPEKMAELDQLLKSQLQDNSLDGVGSVLAPAQAMKKLKASGGAAIPVLERMAEQLLLENNRRSLKSVSSGIKTYHEFSTEVLGVPAEATLPPRSSSDMVLFISIFKCGATAANYVGYVAFACKVLQLSLSWRDEQVSLALKGSKKKTLRLGSSCLSQRFVLDHVALRKVILLARNNSDWPLADRCCVWWNYLLRVQSEGALVHCGSDADAISLPLGVSSSVWVSQRKQAAFCRLRRRKHKPAGSLLLRLCTCSEDEILCVFHAVLRLTKDARPGEQLWSLTAHEIQSKVRRYLEAAKVHGGENMTLKAFRAGKANSMAAKGCGFQAILEAGEWRSRAVFNYLQNETIDKISLLDAAIEQSDAED